MTIDMAAFEMTLEVLGDGDDASNFFQIYERETRKDLESMRKYIEGKDWIGLKRVCHTWKGRASQIGFRKSAYLAGNLHDFLQRTKKTENIPSTSTSMSMSPSSTNEELFLNQVVVFLDTLERECDIITTFLKSQYLL